MKKMTATNYIGLILMVMSMALFIIMYNFSAEMLQLIDSEHGGSCTTYEGCPHIAVLNQAYVGYGLSAIIFVIGVFLLFYGGKPAKIEASENERKKKWEEKIKTLTGDEKLVYEKIIASNGVMFQSDLVERSGFPKAKVSRLLDRMEAGGLVERKRRGMANAIVLK
jgi:uncharacterized membrane protein